MAGDAAVAETAALSPRADVALLTLQLRSVQREAVEAEAQERGRRDDDAVAQLRERLQGLIAERRAALDAQLAEVRVEVAERLAAAEAEAARIVALAEADRPAPEPVDLDGDVTIVWAEPLLEVPAEVRDEPALDDAELAEQTGVVDDAEPVDDAELTDDAGVAPDAVFPPPSHPAVTGTSVTVVLDVDSFAKAFAAAFVAAMDHRDRTAPPTHVIAPPASSFPPRRRSSFWSHAWHADVVLAFVAMFVVLVVLAAWTS